MEDITIKSTDNGFFVTQGKKSYVAKSVYGLTDVILKITKESTQDTPPPVPVESKAKKISIK